MGRNFTEALGKAMRSTETKVAGFWTGPRGRPVGRGAARGAADAGRRPALPRRAGAGRRRDRRAGRRGQRLRPLVRRPDRAGPRGRRRRSATRRRSPPELLRRAKRHGLSDRQIAALRPGAGRRGRRPDAALAAGHPAGLQDRRHLRRRVRRPHAVPLLLLRRGDRGRAAGEAGGADPRLRARTGSGRASSSTTPACTRSWRCRTPATRR